MPEAPPATPPTAEHQPRVAPLTAALVPAAATLHRRAFRGSMNASLGGPYARAFLGWFAAAAARSEAVALAAVAEAGPLGYAVGAPMGYGESLSRALLLPAALGLAPRPWLLVRRRFLTTALGRVLALLRPRRAAEGGAGATAEPAGITVSLVGIGVAPEARGRGVGDALMTAFEARARELGATSLRLSVYPDNHAARRLYERHGWRPAESGGEAPRRGAAMVYVKSPLELRHDG